MPGRLHIHEQKRDTGLTFGCLRIGAHQAEDPVGVLAQRGPGLLSVDDVAVAVADRGGAQRGQVRAGFRFGEALTPPDVHAGGRRQEALLDFLRPELGDHRAHHFGVEVQRLRDAVQLHFVGPDLELGGRPVLSAPLDGPVRHREFVLVQQLVVGHDLLAGQRLALSDPVTNLGGDLRGVEIVKLVAKGGFVRCECQLHWQPPLSGVTAGVVGPRRANDPRAENRQSCTAR